MKKTIFIQVILLGCFLQSFAQQDAMYSQYMFNQMIINPAYTGHQEVFTATALDRHQWIGIDGAPVTQTLSIDAPFNKNRVGAGLSVYNDKVGITKNTGINLTYAYRIRFRKSTLALGLQGGISHLRANFNQVQYSMTNNTNDPAFANSFSSILPSFGTGMFYSTMKYYIGLSSPNLIRSSWVQNQTVQGYKRATHVYLSSGYVFKFNREFNLKPSILVKYVSGAPIELDVNANFWMYDIFAIGLSYRTGDAVVAMLEMQINDQLRLGYAFDYTLTRLNQFNYGSHELMLRYQMRRVRSRTITPRFF